MFLVSSAMKRNAVQQFSFAYGAAVSSACLKQLIKAGPAALKEMDSANSVIVAVKNPALLSLVDRENPFAAAKAAADFRSALIPEFLKAGAVLAGAESAMLIFCFGSPLERIAFLQKNKKLQGAGSIEFFDNAALINRAIKLLAEIIPSAPESWRFGIDCGECSFSWSKETGYIANGRAVVRARILSSLALQYKSRILISHTVREKIEYSAVKLNEL